MENSNNTEAVSLTGQATTSLRRNYSSRKRQRIATIGLALVLILVVGSVLAWVIIFRPNELGCATLQEAICQKPQETYFNATLFKPVYMDTENENYVFRSNFPLKDNYQIDTTELHSKIKEIAGFDTFNVNDYQMNYFTIANITSGDQELCGVAGMFCYEATHHTSRTVPAAKFNLTNIVGDETNPFEYDEEPNVKSLAWQGDRLDLKVNELKESINSTTRNIIIICGKDGMEETGELATSFKLYHSLNFSQAVQENIDLGSRRKPFFNSLMWYCLYLKSSNSEMTCQNIYNMKQFSDIEFQD